MANPENNEPIIDSKSKGWYVNPEQYAAFQQSMENVWKIDQTIDKRSQDTLRDLWMDIKVENWKVIVARGIVSHFSTLKLEWANIPNWKAITFDKWDKLSLESFNTIQNNGGSTEVAVFVVKDKNGLPIGKIQAESYKDNNWSVPKWIAKFK